MARGSPGGRAPRREGSAAPVTEVERRARAPHGHGQHGHPLSASAPGPGQRPAIVRQPGVCGPPLPPWAPRGAPGVCPEHSLDHEGVGGGCTFQSAEAPILGGGSSEHEQSPQRAKQIDMFVHQIPRLESTAAWTGAWTLLVGGDVKRAFLESNLLCVPRALRMLAYAALDVPLLTNRLRKISKIEAICMSLATLPWYVAHCLSEYGPWASLGTETRGYFYFLLQHVSHFLSYPHCTLLL